MTSCAVNASSNLAALAADARMLIEADKAACLIRWKVRELKGTERQRQAQLLISAVHVSVQAAVVGQLKARASK